MVVTPSVDGTLLLGGHCSNVTSLTFPLLVLWLSDMVKLRVCGCGLLVMLLSASVYVSWWYSLVYLTDTWRSMDGPLDCKSEVISLVCCVLIPSNPVLFSGKILFHWIMVILPLSGEERVIFGFELWNVSSWRNLNCDLWPSFYPGTWGKWAT